MQQISTMTAPTTEQLKRAFGLLRSHGGLPIRFESGADPRVDLSDPDHPVMVCDGGILDALLEQRLAVVDHAAGLFLSTNCFEV